MLCFRVLCDSWYFQNLAGLFPHQAMDLFDMGEGYSSLQDGLSQVKCPVMVIGVQTDILFPIWQQRTLADLLQKSGSIGHSMMSSNIEDYNIANLICTLYTNMHTQSPCFVSVLLYMNGSTSLFLSMQLKNVKIYVIKSFKNYFSIDF